MFLKLRRKQGATKLGGENQSDFSRRAGAGTLLKLAIDKWSSYECCFFKKLPTPPHTPDLANQNEQVAGAGYNV